MVGERGLAGEIAALAGHVQAGGAAQAAGAAPIDRAYLARFTLGNAELEREILELFAAQTPIYLEQLHSAATRQAWKETAHAIKGSALAVGAGRLATLTRVAEQLGVEADEAARERALRAVAEAAEEVCRHIACLFATA